jgi:hypothetical protein
MQKLNVGKTKMWATSAILKNAKVNNRPMGENSPIWTPSKSKSFSAAVYHWTARSVKLW